MSTPRTRAPSNYQRGRGSAGAVSRSVDDSIEAKVGAHIQPQPNGCWLFNGRSDSYARHRMFGLTSAVAVHRFVYETFVGPVPDGHHVHHKCETPGCCNPRHLVALTPKEHKAAHRSKAGASD